MAELNYIKELLSTSTGTQGTLLIVRTIHDSLIDEVEKNLIPRELAAIYVGPGQIMGSSYEFNLVSPDSMDVRRIGEGAEIWMDQVAYTTSNVLPLKYGVGIRITRELLEDAKWNLLDHNVKYAGKRLAENENSLIITALDGAANTVSGGATVTIANLTRAVQYLEDSDFTGTDLLVGPEVANDLRNLDTFAEADKFGNREMMERGLVGSVYGLKVWKVSTNAGMTTTTAYVLDRSQAYALVEKRPVTVENFELPVFDMSGAVVTQRLAISLLRSSAVAIITPT